MRHSFHRTLVVCAAAITFACDPGEDDSAFDADDERTANAWAQELLGGLTHFSQTTLTRMDELARDNIISRCVVNGFLNCDAGDEAYWAAINENHELMRCNSPFRAMSGFVSLSTPAFLQWLDAEGAKLGFSRKALPFTLQPSQSVTLFHGASVDAEDWVSGVLVSPLKISIGGWGAGFSHVLGTNNVTPMIYSPTLSTPGGLFLSGSLAVDLTAGFINVGVTRSFKIGGQEVSAATGVCFKFDPHRLINLVNPSYWLNEPIGECGGDDGDPGGPHTCVACIAGGGGKACAAECDGEACLSCIEGGGGKACAARCG